MLHNDNQVMIEGDDINQSFLESIPYFAGRLNENFRDSLLSSPHVNELDLSIYKEITNDTVVTYFIYKNEQYHKRLDDYLTSIVNMKKDGNITGILQLSEFFADFSMIQSMINNRMKISETEFLNGCSEGTLTKISRDYLETVFSVKLPFDQRIHKFVTLNDGIARIIWRNYKIPLLKNYFQVTNSQFSKYMSCDFKHLIQLSKDKKHRKIMIASRQTDKEKKKRTSIMERRSKLVVLRNSVFL